MPITPEEGVARWKQENPPPITVHENGEERELTPEEYEAMAQDRGPMIAQMENEQEAKNADVAEGKSIMQKVTALETTADRLDSTEQLTAAQTRHFNAEHMRVTAQVMRYLNKHSANPVPEE
jgi:hypothetical protein